MFDNLSQSFLNRRRTKAIKAALNDHQVHISLLRETLFPNISQDVFYADFPNLPAHSTKEWRNAGPYRFKVMTNFTGPNNRIAIAVHEGETWLGSFITDGIEAPWASLTLPGDITKPGDIQERAATLFQALLYLDVTDTESRRRPAAA